MHSIRSFAAFAAAALVVGVALGDRPGRGGPGTIAAAARVDRPADQGGRRARQRGDGRAAQEDRRGDRPRRRPARVRGRRRAARQPRADDAQAAAMPHPGDDQADQAAPRRSRQEPKTKSPRQRDTAGPAGDRDVVSLLRRHHGLFDRRPGNRPGGRRSRPPSICARRSPTPSSRRPRPLAREKSDEVKKLYERFGDQLNVYPQFSQFTVKDDPRLHRVVHLTYRVGKRDLSYPRPQVDLTTREVETPAPRSLSDRGQEPHGPPARDAAAGQDLRTESRPMIERTSACTSPRRPSRGALARADLVLCAASPARLAPAVLPRRRSPIRRPRK